jgi:uncharacterized membrane protein (GlpM family)
MRKMNVWLFPLYFIIGGLVVAFTAYFGTRGQGLLAAFVSLFPGATVITFLAIYYGSGASAVTSYSKGMLILLPPWILYVLGIYFLTPRLGIIPSLIISIAVFALSSFFILRLR